jgi:hypothetical protein
MQFSIFYVFCMSAIVDTFARKQNEWVAKQKAPTARRAIVEE